MNFSTLQHGMTLIDSRYKHVLEFGVCQGVSMRTIRRRLDNSFSIFGFDSFVGLPEAWIDKKGKTVVTKSRFSTKGKIPDINGVKFYSGWFTDTLPEYLKIAKPIGLLHLDCDLYSSTKEVLEVLNNYVVEGTIVVLDEWFYWHDPYYDDHERKAFLEWTENFDRKYEFINFHDTTPGGEERKMVRILDNPK